MTTISKIVEDKIQGKPFIQEALSRGIINNAALAEELIPEIEKEIGTKVKFSAVNMAIRRLAEKLSAKMDNKSKFDKSCTITLRSGLMAFDLHRNRDAGKYLKDVYSILDDKSGNFLTITHGINETMIIASKKYEKELNELIPKKDIKFAYKNLGSVTIHIPPSSVEVPGLFYLATRSLAWEGINLIDIVSTVTEMTFILKEKDCSRAYEALMKMLEEHT